MLDIQVPYLVDGDVKLAHSNAILRYVSKKAGLEGDNDKAYAISQMFIEEVWNDSNVNRRRYWELYSHAIMYITDNLLSSTTPAFYYLFWSAPILTEKP